MLGESCFAQHIRASLIFWHLLFEISQFFAPRRQLTKTLFLLCQFLAILGDYLGLGPRDKVFVRQLTL
jgi:hypothetical protein